MDPRTDLSTKMLRADGQVVEIIQPGALNPKSNHWRFKESAYRNYEAHLRLALKNWPKPTKFLVPHDMTINTFEHRLRDARQAVLLYGYDIDVQLGLKEAGPSLSVSVDIEGNAIWIRPKGQVGRLPRDMVLDDPTKLNTLPNPNAGVVQAYCVLGASGHRKEPVHFQGTIPPEVQDSMTAKYDTAFIYDEQTDVTTMI